MSASRPAGRPPTGGTGPTGSSPTWPTTAGCTGCYTGLRCGEAAAPLEPVPRFLRDDLTGHLVGRDPEEFVFPSRTGGSLRVGNFRRDRFDRAAVAVGLAGRVPHELRRTAASLATASGASIKGVQSMLGHASAAMTLDRYGHLLGDELDAVAERMDAARADRMRTEASGDDRRSAH